MYFILHGHNILTIGKLRNISNDVQCAYKFGVHVYMIHLFYYIDFTFLLSLWFSLQTIPID